MSELETLERGVLDGAKTTVIWLHGLGADGHDFEPFAQELSPPAEAAVRFVFPHAPQRPVTINNGFVMRAWYDIFDVGSDDRREDEDGIRDSARLIEGLIRRENERGVPANRVFLGGFSQGGAMTLFTGLRYPERLAGLLALSAYLPIAEQTQAELRPENLDAPMFFGHGSYDPMVPMAWGKASFEAARNLGAKDVSWREYPMPHSVCPEEIRDIADWLRARF